MSAQRMVLIAGIVAMLVLGCSSNPEPDSDSDSVSGSVSVSGSGSGSDSEAQPQAQVPLVIFDTDIGPDIDDALALALLHGYQKQGSIEIAAVTVSRESEAGAKYSDVLNTFYGRPDIPIGMYYGEMAYRYDDRLSYVSTADSWPNDIANDIADDPIEPGYLVQRSVLAEAAEVGRQVIIVQTGFSGNLSDLVRSPGDEISPMTGQELIEETVSVLSIMAGSFDSDLVEFNVEKNIESARNIFDHWPGPVAVSPFELGNSIHYPYSSIASDYDWVERHPVKTAYEFEDLGWHHDAPPFYDMRSWDLTSVIQGIEPEADFFKTTQTGTVTVDGSGRTTFLEGPGQHYVMDRAAEYSDEERKRVIDRMIALTSARP